MKPQALTVSYLNSYIKNKFDDDEFLNNVYVKGEISNFKLHYTGHIYFTLKDEKSVIKCVMFKGYTTYLNFKPKDGDKVVVLGSVNVYEAGGNYQIYVKAMEEQGLGELYKKFEALKKQLSLEGLFDEEHKKTIPKFSKSIGVLTSSTGSVIKDIINVSTRRNSNVQIKLYSVPVQGEGAAEKIAEGIDFFNKYKNVDVIILGRGGGSLEDLWPFNEEVVARAIYNSKLPIISSVGHETDFTISDFVADLRAPTPSAAAELAVPNIAEVTKQIYESKIRLINSINKKIEFNKTLLTKVSTSKVLKQPQLLLQNYYQTLDIFGDKIANLAKHKIKDKKLLFANLTVKLDTLSPLKTLTRGYGIILKNNKVVKKVEDLNTNDKIDIKLVDGKKSAIIV